MRYQLDTIPVWDALKADSECPLCTLRTRSEDGYVEHFLGDSVMEPTTRVVVNQKGFCNRHFSMMLPMKNRLGLALITHTYLKDVITDVQKTMQDAGGAGGSKLLSGFRRTAAGDDGAGAKIRDRVSGCILCERLDTTMRRYAFTLVHLWLNDMEFRRIFGASKGLCLPDMALVMELAASEFGDKKSREFIAALSQLQSDNLSRIEQELEWFTLKFDYRNHDKPWGNSRDAVERAIGKLSGGRS